MVNGNEKIRERSRTWKRRGKRSRLRTWIENKIGKIRRRNMRWKRKEKRWTKNQIPQDQGKEQDIGEGKEETPNKKVE